MISLTEQKERLAKSHSEYREYKDGNKVTLVIFGLNAPEVMKFLDGKYIGKR